VSFAAAFEPGARQTRSDAACAWAAIDWDIRQRSPAIVQLVAPRAAAALAALAPVTDAESLAAACAVVEGLTPDLRAIDRSAQVASGWTANTPHAAEIVQVLCAAAWAACVGGCHGQAWSAARRYVTLPPRADAATRLTRLAARARTWQLAGAAAVRDITAFDPESVRPAFADALATIARSRAALVEQF
jgi:hypothetical protein